MMAAAARRHAAGALTVGLVDPDGDEARACLEAYFRELQARFDEGFDPGRSVSADPQALRPPCGAFLVAHLQGRSVGCVALKVEGPRLGEIKRMWVAPESRGLGVARRLRV